MRKRLESLQTMSYHTNMYRGECNKTHGGSKTRLYRIWKQMRTRCNCKTTPKYKFYGARGITVCEEWEKFEAFREWALNNGYTDSLSIERKNVNMGYSPENCCWIYCYEQSKNTRNIKKYSYGGIVLCHNDWARRLGINPATLTQRIQRHGIETALSMSKGVRV